jgi:beta-galactosidase
MGRREKSFMRKFLVGSILVLFAVNFSFGQRQVQLSDSWLVWLDKEAVWQNDSLYLPQNLNLNSIPKNEPAGGWESLYSKTEITCQLPATFEELFGDGDPFWRYHGIGWFVKEIDVPANWAQKTIRLNIEKVRLRMEIYVNESLAGYDIVAETPFSIDISKYLKPGSKNKIAIRITNPGGQRGWNDSPSTTWANKYKLIPGHDFGCLSNVSLTVTSNCYIHDVFVKNLLPATKNNIEIQVSVENKLQPSVNTKVEVEIVPYPSGKAVYKNTFTLEAENEKLSTLIKKINVPAAKLWDVNSPNLPL